MGAPPQGVPYPMLRTYGPHSQNVTPHMFKLELIDVTLNTSIDRRTTS